MAFFQKLLTVASEEGLPGLSLRIETRFFKAFLLFARSLGITSVKSRYGPRFRANYGDKTFEYYIIGNYGVFYWKRLKSIDHPFVFLDIGANQGLYSIGAAQNKNLSFAYAFEPVKGTAHLLRQNLKLNGVVRKVFVFDVAISDKSGCAEISKPEGHSGAASLMDLQPEVIEKETIRTEDYSFINAKLPRSTSPIYVKIDVEGHEETVLHQLFRSNIGKDISEIFFEVNDGWSNASKLMKLVESEGFNLKKIGNAPHYDVLAVRSVSRRAR